MTDTQFSGLIKLQLQVRQQWKNVSAKRVEEIEKEKSKIILEKNQVYLQEGRHGNL